MNHRFVFGLLLGVLVSISSTANAGVMVTLSSPTDLNSLTVGQDVQIDVNVVGSPDNNFIFVLNTQVLFSSSLFDPVPDPGNSSGLTPGSVFLNDAVFGPLQRANFNAASSLNPGSAIGNFSDSSPAPSAAIGQNGLYFSFILQAKAAGSGTISFDPANSTYAATETNFNLAPLPTGGPLTFTINPAVAVPEPSTLASFAVGGLLLGLGRLARRSTSARKSVA